MRRFLELLSVLSAALLAAPACEHAEERPSSRTARPVATSWAACGYPANTRAASGWAKLRAYVDARGVVVRVEVLGESERTFGDHAGNCAFAKTFRPAVDANGQPAPAWTPPFTVRFVL